MKRWLIILVSCIFLMACNSNKTIIPPENTPTDNISTILDNEHNQIPSLSSHCQTIATDGEKLIAVMSDGKVHVIGPFVDTISPQDGVVIKCFDNTGTWENIKTVAVKSFVYGINNNGELVSNVPDVLKDSLPGKNNVMYISPDGTGSVDNWGNVNAGETEKFYPIIGNWSNVIKYAGYCALKSDGTVSVVTDRYGEVLWSNMIDIASNGRNTIFGVRKDGRVYVTGDSTGCKTINCYDVGNWENIVAIFTSSSHTVGLKNDGTVVAVGDNEYGQCDVSDWNDIVDIAVGTNVTVGLKSDGTLVVTGGRFPESAQWKNVKIPDRYVTLSEPMEYNVKQAVCVKGYSIPKSIVDNVENSLSGKTPNFSYSLVEQKESVIYDGNPIPITVKVNNYGPANPIGIMVSINGVLQKVSFDKDEQGELINAVDFKPNEEKQLTYYVKPNVGQMGETLYLTLMFSNNPKVLVSDTTDTFFPYTYIAGGVHGFKVVMNDNANESVEIEKEKVSQVEFTEEEIKKLVYTDNKGMLQDKLANLNVPISNDYVIKNNVISVKQELYGGEKDEYIVTAVINGVPVKQWEVSIEDRKHKSVINDEVQLEDYLVNDYNTLYFVAISKKQVGKMKQSASIKVKRVE